MKLFSIFLLKFLWSNLHQIQSTYSGDPKVTYSYSDPEVTYSDPKVTYDDPRVTYSDPKMTYTGPKHFPFSLPSLP